MVCGDESSGKPCLVLLQIISNPMDDWVGTAPVQQLFFIMKESCFLAVSHEKSFVFKLNINVLLFADAEFKIPS